MSSVIVLDSSDEDETNTVSTKKRKLKNPHTIAPPAKVSAIQATTTAGFTSLLLPTSAVARKAFKQEERAKSQSPITTAAVGGGFRAEPKVITNGNTMVTGNGGGSGGPASCGGYSTMNRLVMLKQSNMDAPGLVPVPVSLMPANKASPLATTPTQKLQQSPPPQMPQLLYHKSPQPSQKAKKSTSITTTPTQHQSPTSSNRKLPTLTSPYLVPTSANSAVPSHNLGYNQLQPVMQSMPVIASVCSIASPGDASLPNTTNDVKEKISRTVASNNNNNNNNPSAMKWERIPVHVSREYDETMGRVANEYDSRIKHNKKSISSSKNNSMLKDNASGIVRSPNSFREQDKQVKPCNVYNNNINNFNKSNQNNNNNKQCPVNQTANTTTSITTKTTTSMAHSASMMKAKTVSSSLVHRKSPVISKPTPLVAMGTGAVTSLHKAALGNEKSLSRRVPITTVLAKTDKAWKDRNRLQHTASPQNLLIDVQPSTSAMSVGSTLTTTTTTTTASATITTVKAPLFTASSVQKSVTATSDYKLQISQLSQKKTTTTTTAMTSKTIPTTTAAITTTIPAKNQQPPPYLTYKKSPINNDLYAEPKASPSKRKIETLSPVTIMDLSKNATIEKHKAVQRDTANPSPSNPTNASSTKNSVGNELTPDFLDLLKSCRAADSSKDMEMLIKNKLIKYYQEVHPSFVKSRGFCKNLRTTIEHVNAAPDMVYMSLATIVDELKARRVKKGIVVDALEEDCKAANQESTKVDTMETTTSTGNKRTDAQIKKLSKALHIVKRRIEALEQQEVDWDAEDSTYVQVARYKKRACQIFEKICDLTGEKKDALRAVKKPIHFSCTKYSEFNKMLEAFVNRTRQFPDFCDVYRLMEHCNGKFNYELVTFQMKQIALDSFTKVGKLLQSRRKTDLYETVAHFTGNSKDPAEFDAILSAKLSDNEKTKKRISDVIERYAREQDLTAEEREQLRIKEIASENGGTSNTKTGETQSEIALLTSDDDDDDEDDDEDMDADGKTNVKDIMKDVEELANGYISDDDDDSVIEFYSSTDAGPQKVVSEDKGDECKTNIIASKKSDNPAYIPTATVSSVDKVKSDKEENSESKILLPVPLTKNTNQVEGKSITQADNSKKVKTAIKVDDEIIILEDSIS